MTDVVTLRVPGAAQRATMRCGTGTHFFFKNMGPASAVHRYTLHRVRDTRSAP
jgi:hypothetical protein